MPDLYDKPKGSLRLTDAELAAIRKRCRRSAGLIRRWGDGALTDAESLRREWHKLFRGCLLLNDDRVAAVLRRLDDGFEPAQIYWSIVAYSEECKTVAWRREHPSARKTFEAFLLDGRFELYVEQGDRLRDQDAARRQLKRARVACALERTAEDALRDAFDMLPDAERSRLEQRAIALLEAAGKPLPKTVVMRETFIRSKALQLFQRERQTNPLARTQRLGEVV